MRSASTAPHCGGMLVQALHMRVVIDVKSNIPGVESGRGKVGTCHQGANADKIALAFHRLQWSSVSPNQRKGSKWPSAGHIQFCHNWNDINCFRPTDSIDQRTCMSSVQPSMSGSIFSAVYSSQTLNIDRDRIGVTQLFVAISSVMPLGVGHVALGCSPSGPGISPSSTGGIASAGSISPSTDDAERFVLKQPKQHGITAA